MRFATLAAVLAASVAVNAQNVTSTANNIIGNLSPGCLTALVSLATNTQLTSCLNATGIYSLLNTNGSIIPAMDSYLASTCGSQPCSNSTLMMAASKINSGCSAELTQYNITNTTVNAVFAGYPLAREVACLKTTAPAAANFTNASIPLNSSSYNTTNGTFCVTSLLTQLSGYLGANLTTSYITSTALSVVNGNYSALTNLTKIPPTALCQDCIFGAVDLIELSYPSLGTQNFTIMNSTFNVNSALNSTCNATGYSVSMNGTLPSTLRESAYNSTFGFTVTAGNMTYPAAGNSTTSSNSTSTSSAMPTMNTTAASTTASSTATGTRKRSWGREAPRL